MWWLLVCIPITRCARSCETEILADPPKSEPTSICSQNVRFGRQTLVKSRNRESPCSPPICIPKRAGFSLSRSWLRDASITPMFHAQKGLAPTTGSRGTHVSRPSMAMRAVQFTQISCQMPALAAKNTVFSPVLSLTSLRHHVEWIEGVVCDTGGQHPQKNWAVGPLGCPVRLRAVAKVTERTDAPLEGIVHVSSITEKEREHHHQ